jgi:elongation factor P
MAIKFKGEIGVVLDTEHRTPGKGNALIMATIRSFQSGKTKDIRFASSDKVDVIPVDRKKLEFSYSDAEGFHFMDPVSFEMTPLPESLFEETRDMLTENMEVEVMFVDGKPVSADLPASVELKVTASAPGEKGDTANNPQKPATLETGKEVMVPLFIKEGDVVKVDTRTGKYMGRV